MWLAKFDKTRSQLSDPEMGQYHRHPKVLSTPHLKVRYTTHTQTTCSRFTCYWTVIITLKVHEEQKRNWRRQKHKDIQPSTWGGTAYFTLPWRNVTATFPGNSQNHLRSLVEEIHLWRILLKWESKMGNFSLLFYVFVKNMLENHILMSIPKWKQLKFTEWIKTHKYILVLLKLLTFLQIG